MVPVAVNQVTTAQGRRGTRTRDGELGCPWAVSFVEVTAMFHFLSRYSLPFALATTLMATALMIGGAGGAIAQTEPTPPPLPQADTQQPTAPGTTDNTTANTAASAQANFPALPPGHDDV